MQLLKDSTILIKNGTLVATSDKIKMLIQNYSNLTLDNVKLVGSPTCNYLCSNNYGTVTFKNGTEFHPYEGKVAFDVWYGMFDVYDIPGVNVTIADNSVVVEGTVEFGKAGRASVENFAEHASLTVPNDMDIEISTTMQGLDWTEGPNDTKVFKYVG